MPEVCYFCPIENCVLRTIFTEELMPTHTMLDGIYVPTTWKIDARDGKMVRQTFDSRGQTFDSEGESCFSERSEAKHSPEESKSLPEGIKSA